MPDDAHKAASKELKRLRKMPQQMPEHAMIRYERLTHSHADNVWCF